MVHLYKLPGEFDISDVRESFMRQHIEPEVRITLDLHDSEHDMVPYIRKSPVKLVKHAALVKSGGLLEKRSGISSIVRYVESSVSEISVLFDWMRIQGLPQKKRLVHVLYSKRYEL